MTDWPQCRAYSHRCKLDPVVKSAIKLVAETAESSGDLVFHVKKLCGIDLS